MSELTEEWRPVIGYEGLYEVSDRGSVRNRRGQTLKGGTGKRGYQYVSLSKLNSPSTKSIHRLVACAFIPNPDSLPEVNHLDGNKTNNVVKNLEWSTVGDNRRHAVHVLKAGHIMPVTQLTKKGLEVVARFDSQSEAMRATGIDSGDISKCISGHRKSAGGFRWHQHGPESK